MSLVLPGWGQFYNGHASRGLIWYLGIMAYGLAYLHWSALWIGFGVRGFLFAWGLVLVGYVLAAVEAAVSARRAPRRRSYQKWWCYILVFVLATLSQNLVIPTVCDVFRVTLAVKPYTIPSGSMVPSLEPGDLALVDMRAYYDGSPKQFEPVILSYPDETDRDYVARVVAGPGDSCRIEDGNLFVNGEQVGSIYTGILEEMKETLIQPGHVFVMGDNVNNSRDSRYRGQVPITLVRGRIKGIVWPLGRVTDFNFVAPQIP